MKISIVIPVYNEKPTLGEMLRRVMAAPLPDGCEREVIIVDDGSTDGTSSVLDACRSTYRGMLICHSSINQGKGRALRLGIAQSSGDVILVQDGDLEYEPADYLAVLQPLVTGAADVVYGSRFQGQVIGLSFANRCANRMLTFAANLLFDARITDEATAYKAFRAPVLRQLRLTCRRFEFCPEVTAKVRRLGYVIHEVPIRYHPRSVEQGKKIRWWDGVSALWTLAKYRLVRKASLVNRSTSNVIARHSAQRMPESAG